MRHYLLIIAIGLFVAEIFGCSRTDYRFRVIDDSTGRALAGVHLTISCHGHYLNNRLFPGDEVTPDLISGPGGDIVANRVIDGPGWERDLTFTCPGYETIFASNGVAAPSDYWVFHYMEPNFPGSTLTVAQCKLSRADVNLIRMRRFTKTETGQIN
jgi:hypothetical protein